MLTLKRLYLYAVLGISLAVLVSGLYDVVRIAFDQLGDAFGSTPAYSEDLRSELSWALALFIVSTPVFAVHLGLVRRSLRGPARQVADERACASRATYFFLVLAATAVFAGGQLIELVDTVLGAVAFGERPWGLAGSAAAVVVGGGTWLAHLWARRRDLREAAGRTAGDWLTRAYLYGALFITALATCFGAGNLLTTVGRGILDLQPAWSDPAWWRDDLTVAVGIVTVAAAAWAGHWVLGSGLLRAAPPMGEAHRASRTRAGSFGAVVAVSAAAVLVLVAMGLRSLFTAAVGTAAPLTDTRLIEEVAGPLLLAVPYLVAWWWHLRRLTAEALAFRGQVHAQAARRAGRLVVSFVGLAGFSVGVAWELQSLLDAIASTGQDTLFSSAEAGEVTASALATALVGLALWAPAWVLLQRERAREVVVVATSAARRAYLFLVSGVAVVALMGALAFVIYQATRMLLGTELIDDASWALAVLIVAAVVLAYHLICLRADLLVARTVAPPEADADEAGRAVETIEISAPEGADFKVLNAAIRTELPEGYELRVVSHHP